MMFPYQSDRSIVSQNIESYSLFISTVLEQIYNVGTNGKRHTQRPV